MFLRVGEAEGVAGRIMIAANHYRNLKIFITNNKLTTRRKNNYLFFGKSHECLFRFCAS